MDYIGNKCPVCDKYFHIGDDIVVCPECGTPHHRECYNNNGQCTNAKKHSDGFDYQESIKDSSTDNGNRVVCKNCGTQNDSDAFFCSRCGNPLSENKADFAHNTQNKNTSTEHTFGSDSSPFAQSPHVIMYDPLAGVSPNTDIGDGVTVAETAKFVRQNTPYFITIFNNIKKFSKSRFNFCALFFGGGYLLFRKMYKVGTIITAIQAAMTIMYFYLNYYISSNNAFDKLFDAAYTYDTNATALYMSELSSTNLMILLLYCMLAFMMLIMDIVIGACANRMYYSHCKKQILKIKRETEDVTKISDTLVKKGGVNFPLAISLWITYIILSYFPLFFS